MTTFQKLNGSIYTPTHIVKNILDLVGYTEEILDKHIIDNSCGEGAFLAEVVSRYCNAYLRSYTNKAELRRRLELYIHGIDSDENAIIQCRNNLDAIAHDYGLSNISWDVNVGDTLETNFYDGRMDFVVGNPPYVRVHNLEDNYSKVKKFKFARNGMTDLYIVFYEIGLKMLNKAGKMGLITPSSFLRSKAGASLRKTIYATRNLVKVVDLGHYQPFNATTYTMITVFDNSQKAEKIEYSIYDEFTLRPEKVEDLDYESVFISGSMYFSTKENLHLLYYIEDNYARKNERKIIVKNGFATLADDVFIGFFPFNDCTINVLKASTGKWYRCIFPYHSNGCPFSLEELKKHTDVYTYLLKNKERLEQRDIDNNGEWFLFGRSQAIKDVFIDKVAVNTIIKDIPNIKIETVPAGNGVFSGLYILSNYSENKIKSSLETENFINYLKLLKNYKSGGYYSINALELEKYLNFALENILSEQLRIFEYN